MAGLGSVQKTGKYSWKLTVSSGFDDSGKRVRHTKTVKVTNDDPEKQEKEANQQLALFIAEIEKGNTASAGKTNIAQFCDLWQKNHAKRHLAPKTIHRYNQLIDSWIVPALGNIKLNKLKPTQILSFYGNLEESGIRKDGKEGALSPRTRLHIHRLLHTILETAVQWEYLNSNPVSKVKAPKAEKAKISIIGEEELERFILLLDNEELKWKVLSLLTLTAGLRIGEAMGLEWKHIDFAKHTISVEQSSQYVGKKIITKSTKNQSSERLISIPSSMIDLLKQYRAQQNADRLLLGDKWNDTDRLFTAWNGLPMFPSSFNKWLTAFCKRNNLTKITPHSLRHLSATILINAGISLKNISARLGHNRTSTTGDIYAHFLKSTDTIAAEKMDEIMKPSTKKTQSN